MNVILSVVRVYSCCKTVGEAALEYHCFNTRSGNGGALFAGLFVRSCPGRRTQFVSVVLLLLLLLLLLAKPRCGCCSWRFCSFCCFSTATSIHFFPCMFSAVTISRKSGPDPFLDSLKKSLRPRRFASRPCPPDSCENIGLRGFSSSCSRSKHPHVAFLIPKHDYVRIASAPIGQSIHARTMITS